MKQPVVYIVANKRNGIIYTGVTSNLVKRVYEHKYGLVAGFTKKYNCKLLVFYKIHEIMYTAITREKQIKAGSRKAKLKIIERVNPEWEELYKYII